MDILIEDKKVRKLCEDAKHARKKLGDNNDAVDWQAVRTVRIIEIGDYHD